MPLTVQLLYNLAFKKEHIFRTGFEYGKIISRVDPIPIRSGITHIRVNINKKLM